MDLPKPALPHNHQLHDALRGHRKPDPTRRRPSRRLFCLLCHHLQSGRDLIKGHPAVGPCRLHFRHLLRFDHFQSALYDQKLGHDSPLWLLMGASNHFKFLYAPQLAIPLQLVVHICAVSILHVPSTVCKGLPQQFLLSETGPVASLGSDLPIHILAVCPAFNEA